MEFIFTSPSKSESDIKISLAYPEVSRRESEFFCILTMDKSGDRTISKIYGATEAQAIQLSFKEARRLVEKNNSGYNSDGMTPLEIFPKTIASQFGQNFIELSETVLKVLELKALWLDYKVAKQRNFKVKHPVELEPMDEWLNEYFNDYQSEYMKKISD